MKLFVRIKTIPMSEFRTLEVISSIQDDVSSKSVTINELRADVVIESSETERKNIIDHFPSSKNNYLVVPKVIEH